MSNYNAEIELKIDGRVTGVVRGNVLDVRKRKTHYIKKHKGYGISPQTLDEAEELGASEIRLSIIETGESWQVSIANFRKYAILDKLGNFPAQLFMPRMYLRWIVSHTPTYKNQPQLIQPELFR